MHSTDIHIILMVKQQIYQKGKWYIMQLLNKRVDLFEAEKISIFSF